MARSKDMITIKDPKALRALAHPARQRLLTELFGGRVLTATEAADMVGLTPSAVSHHLRALEKYGLAKRATSSGDGRQRPWQGTGRTLSLEPSAMAGSLPAMQSVIAVQVGEFAEQLNHFISSRLDDPWKGSYTGMARGDLWLTREETEQLRDTVMETIAGFDKKRRHQRPPKGTRRTAFTWSLVPLDDGPRS